MDTPARDPFASLFDQAPARSEPGSLVPIYLVAGFLGSGKTTLLRTLLAHPGCADTALIINEFGEIGLDHLLVQSAIENTLVLENGCICCSIRGDLVDTVGDLFTRAASGAIPPFSRIVIETTGLADPGPIIQDLVGARGLRSVATLQKVVVTIDGALGEQQLRDHPEVLNQIVHADHCLVTKTDLVDPNVINALVQTVRDINPAAEVESIAHGVFDVARFLAPPALAGGRDGRAALAQCDLGDDCTHGPDEPCPHVLSAGPSSRSGSARHGAVASWSATIDEPLSRARVTAWLDLIYSLRASHILRMKGVFNLIGENGPVIMQGVGAMVSPPVTEGSWEGRRRRSQLVVITRDLDPRVVGATFEALVRDKAKPQDAPRPVRARNPYALAET